MTIDKKIGIEVSTTDEAFAAGNFLATIHNIPLPEPDFYNENFGCGYSIVLVDENCIHMGCSTSYYAETRSKIVKFNEIHTLFFEPKFKLNVTKNYLFTNPNFEYDICFALVIKGKASKLYKNGTVETLEDNHDWNDPERINEWVNKGIWTLVKEW